MLFSVFPFFFLTWPQWRSQNFLLKKVNNYIIDNKKIIVSKFLFLRGYYENFGKIIGYY